LPERGATVGTDHRTSLKMLSKPLSKIARLRSNSCSSGVIVRFFSGFSLFDNSARKESTIAMNHNLQFSTLFTISLMPGRKSVALILPPDSFSILIARSMEGVRRPCKTALRYMAVMFNLFASSVWYPLFVFIIFKFKSW
jgi:hypothetical protein